MKLQRSFGSLSVLKLPVFIVASMLHAQNYSLQTLIGGPLVTEGASVLNAVLRYPVAVASDSAGNMFVADREDNRIWKVDAAGAITAYAGNGATGYAGDNEPAVQATLNHPAGVALDAAGSVYICDTGNNVVRRVGTDGTITTVAGNGTAGHTGDNGPARKAQIAALAIALDPAGNLLISEGYRVRQVLATTGNITTIAGTSTSGYSGDAGQATKAKLTNITGIAVDANGIIYLADTGAYVIRYIDTKGVIRTIAGYGYSGESGDGNAPTSAKIVPDAIAVNPAGTVIYTANSSVGTVRRIDLSVSTVSLVAGTYFVAGFQGDGQDAGSALLWGPSCLTFDSSNNLLVCDSINQRIRRISAVDNRISTVAGSSADTVLNHPQAITLDHRGDIYIADTGNNAVKQLQHESGGFTSLEKNSLRPEGIATDSNGNLYITSQDYFLYKFTNPQWTVVAGNGTDANSGDGGSAYWAQFGRLTSLTMDRSANLYIADYENHVIRKIDSKGTITLVAGSGSVTATGDNGPATSAGLDAFDVAADSAGNVYVADRANHRVRRVSPNGIITTIAGSGTAGFAGDNGLATQANLNSPTGVAIDSAGNIYIADNGNARIRLVTPDGVIQTIAGNGVNYPFNGDGPALRCNFSPYRIAIDTDNAIYVADWANDRVRLLTLSQ